MNSERLIQFAVLLLVGAATAATLFLLRQNIASEDYNSRMHLLQDAVQLNTRLDLDIERILSRQLNNYDPLVETTQLIRTNLRQLDSNKHGIRGEIGNTLDQQLDAYLASNRQRLELLERIKSEMALLRNSLQYLPRLISDYLTHPVGGQFNHLAGLQRALMEYSLFPSTTNKQLLQDQLNTLKIPLLTESDLSQLRNTILVHSESLIRGHERIEELLRRYHSQPSATQLQQLHDSYEHYYKQQSDRFYLTSRALFAATLLLLIGLGVAIYRMRLAHHASAEASTQLHDALESLSEPFVLFDNDQRLLLWNQRFTELCPYAKEMLVPGIKRTELAEHYIERGEYATSSSLLNSLLLAQSSINQSGTTILANQRHYLVNHSHTPSGGIATIYTDISDRIAMEHKLYQLSQAVEQSPSLVIITDTSGNIEYVNPKFVEVTGYSLNEVAGKNPRILKSGNTSTNEYRRLWLTIANGGEWRGEFQNKRKNGELYWEFASISGIRDKNGTITHYLAVKEDITERKLAEEQLRIAAAVFNTSNEGIVVTNAHNQIMAVNPSFTKITGYQREEVIGKNPNILNSGQHGPEFYNEMWRALQKHGLWEGEIWNKSKSGEIYPEWLSLSVIKNDAGEVVEHIAIFSDITQRKNAEEKIRWQANYDAITGLPNRTLFGDRLASAINNAHREEWCSALLFIDLDHFKTINDTRGHAIGDLLLKQVAERLLGCVREADTVARLGGDEFTVILQDTNSGGNAAAIAQKIIDRLSVPFNLSGTDAFIGASIGITLYPDDGGDSETLIRNADMAMYRAKEGGRNRYHFFTQSMNEQMLERVELVNDMRYALERGEFFLEFQPIVDAVSEKVIHAEALVRWNHPERGRIPPDRFIPLAEESGLIAQLGWWILEQACTQAKAWSRQGHEIGISVNLSSRQIKAGLNEQQIAELLQRLELKPSLLTLEITEGLLLEDTEEMLQWLNAVRAIGVKLSVDDFGTGFSSLSYLKRFPIDYIKIDKSFVNDVTTDIEDALLVKAIIGLAKSFDLGVIAEGVENGEQLEFLRDHNCPLIQGYHFSRPLTDEAFVAYLNRAA